MILASALMLLAAATAPVESTEPDEIVVIANRLKSLSVFVTRDQQGSYHCDLSASTGLAKLDEALCKATTKCVRKGKATAEAVNLCVEQSKPSLMGQIRDYWRAQNSEKKTV